MTINPTLPVLTEFNGNEVAERVVANACGGSFPPAPTAIYILGCPNTPQGMTFTATAQIPTGPYLSDPAQSGIKYVQIVNSLRKQMQGGSISCETARSQEADIQAGWQRDTSDPFNTYSQVRRFSEGNTLSMLDADSPQNVLAVTSVYSDLEALYVDEIFETYVVYFVGPQPGAPIFQRGLGLQSTGVVSRLAWGWGGLVVYDWLAPDKYRIVSSRTTVGPKAAQPVNAIRPYAGDVTNLELMRCPSGPDLTTNLIDGARFFVRQQYCDIYGRQPDPDGWSYWTSEITKCGFDLECRNSVNGRRTAVAASFFYEAEAQRVDPDLANPPGSPGFNPAVYNPAFVRHCYTGFLRRHPEAEGFEFWVNNLNQYGNYLGVINAFTTTAEYRNRDFRTDLCVTPIH